MKLKPRPRRRPRRRPRLLFEDEHEDDNENDFHGDKKSQLSADGSWPLEQSLSDALCLEGFAAATGALDVGVVKLETGSSQGFNPVNLSAIQIH